MNRALSILLDLAVAAGLIGVAYLAIIGG